VKNKLDQQVATINRLETKISELESHVCPTDNSVLQDDSARIKDLVAQLQAAKDANVNLQKLVAEQQKRIPSGSGGTSGFPSFATGHFKVPTSHSSGVPMTSASSSTPPASFSSVPHPVKSSTSPSPTATPAGTDNEPLTAREVLEIVTRNQSVPVTRDRH